MSLPPSNAALEPRPLPSTGITRLPQYYGPLRHPDRPGLSLAGFRLVRATPPTGLPVLPPSPSSMRAAATTPVEPAGARVARFPRGWQPSPNGRRVGFHIGCFEACSAFTCVAARMVARPPKAARYIAVLQTMSLPPSSAPTASGWSDSCRAGFAPAREWRLSTAHYQAHPARSSQRFTSPGARDGGPTLAKRVARRHGRRLDRVSGQCASSNMSFVRNQDDP